MEEFAPPQDYPLDINIDNGTIYDGDADDNYFLIPFLSVNDYTDRKHGVYLEWYYTDGRAKQIVDYIKNALQGADSVELWHVWLMDYFEYENRPFIHRKSISVGGFSTDHIKEIDSADIWNTPDKTYPDRPSFYCLTITP